MRGMNTQDFSGKGEEMSWKSSTGHFVFVLGFSVSDHGSWGMSFSMLMYYKEHIVRLGVTMKLIAMLDQADLCQF